MVIRLHLPVDNSVDALWARKNQLGTSCAPRFESDRIWVYRIFDPGAGL